MIGSILVVGGGIGGIQATLDLADSGFKVYLLENTHAIGGMMSQLDKTFPTNDCSMCIMAPKLVAVGRHSNVELITNSELLSVEGEAGDFRVKIGKKPRYVNEKKCTGCGVCAQYCPVEAIDLYNAGMSIHPGIFIKYSQAVPVVYSIDRDVCIGCGLCKACCPAEAIEFEQSYEVLNINVGSILLALGSESFNPHVYSHYGYNRFLNVLSSIEFERVLSATGPYGGYILRTSDGTQPSRIAFVQCVGSRDSKKGKDYCSGICCMYAVKEAIIAKEHAPSIESTIFYMDMRSYGKDFDKYVERAKKDYGVRFVNAKVSSIEEIQESRNLIIKYETEDGKLSSEEFDMVILSTGLVPNDEVSKMAQILNIELNEWGFCKTSEFSPLNTTRKGIFVGGTFQAPKDISETVTQCSGASAEASTMISNLRGTLVLQKEYPKEINTTNKKPRIGVFICKCGINIGNYVDVDSVVEYTKTLKNVAYVESNLFTCSQDTQERIKEEIKKYNLTRVVVASCTPRTHEALFQEACQEVGLNRYLFEMANIREHCSWVHMNEKEKATEKAKEIVRMAVYKSKVLEPLPQISFKPVKKGLVLGGGIAGMTASLNLAKQGFEVYLIEKEKELGGNLKHVFYTLQNSSVQTFLQSLIKEVRENNLINLYLNSKVKELKGSVGNFNSLIVNELTGETTEIRHGIAILATGAREYIPQEYSYGEDERIITQRELEEKISSCKLQITNLKSIVMIQCVGSRDEKRQYCSRICCSSAIKNALKIKEINPETEIYILFRDVRTYGFKEIYYKKARERGVYFIRYDGDEKPKVVINSECSSSAIKKGEETFRKSSRIYVLVKDRILNKQIKIPTDLVILSVGIVPNDDCLEISKICKVPLSEEGFFLPAHVKLRPVDFATDGLFVAGLNSSPKFIDETISQANAAVARAITILSKDEIYAEGKIAKVNREKCNACGLCVKVCAFNAVEIVEEKISGKEVAYAKVNETLCKGCGTCCSTCRSSAIDLKGFSNEYMLEAINAL